MEGENTKEENTSSKLNIDSDKVLIAIIGLLLIVIFILVFFRGDKSNVEPQEEINTIEKAEKAEKANIVESEAEKMQKFIDSQPYNPATAEEKAEIQKMINEAKESATEEEKEEGRKMIEALMASSTESR